MNEFTINYRDNRVESFNKNNFDCFLFDSFKITDIMSVLKGDEIDLKRFLLPEKIEFLARKFNYPDRHILSKVSLINSIIQNDPYSRAFLVFQSISWKLAKVKMPYILIPVRIFDNGLKIVKDGDVFINPLVKKYVDEDINIEVHSNKIQEIDSPKLTKIINEANGRIVYEMYLTHFKVEYPLMKTKINKKFVKKEHYINKDLSNRNVLAIDNELTKVFDNINEGHNTIVKAKQGTRKIALITNLIANAIDKNKHLIYVSEKNYSSLKSTLKDVNLLPFIYDSFVDNPFEDGLVDQHKFDKRELRDLIDDLYDYQDKFSYQFKGYTFREVFRELIKLEDLEKQEMEVEFFENLTFDDVEKIKETLIKLEDIITKLDIDCPSKSFWNDVVIRETQNNEDKMIITTTSFINELKKIKEMLFEIKEAAGFILPDDLGALDDALKNLDFMDFRNYPKSWFESFDNFGEAKNIINKINNITGRTMSLYTIIHTTYKRDILDLDVEDIYESLYGDVFTREDKQIISRILANKDKVKKEISALEILIERFKIYKNYFEMNLNMDFDKDLEEFTDSFNKLTDKENFSTEWFGIINRESLINELLSYVHEVELYFMDYNVTKIYFKDEVNQLDLAVVENYLRKFEKTNELDKVEISNSTILVEKYAYTSYFTSSRRGKKVIAQKLKNIITLKDRILEIENLVKERTFIDFDLESIQDVIETMEDTFDFVDKFKDKPGFNELTKSFTELNFKEVNAINLQFKYDLNEFYKLVEDDFYSVAISSSFSQMEEDFEKLFKQIEVIYELDEKVKDLFIKKPNKLTVENFKTIRNTISNYRRNNDYLESQDENLKLLYGENYKGKDTVFKPIRVSIKNFEKFYKLFYDFDTLRDVYHNKSFKTLYENVYKIGITLNNVYVIIDKVEDYFDVVFNDEKIESIIHYFEKYIDIDKLKLWLEYLELNHVLRMYGQLRLASNINNGYIKNNLLNTFMKGFFDKLIELYFVKENNQTLLDKMANFNNLLEERNLFNASYLRTKYKKNKRNIILSSISGLRDITDKHFDIVIIDGAEMIHKNYFNKLTQLGKQVVIIGDEQNINIADSIFNMFSEFPVYELKCNYRLSLHLFDKFGSGVVVGQSISIVKDIYIVDEVLEEFKTNDKLKVNIICFSEDTRKSIFNNVADKLLRNNQLHEEFYSIIDRIKILLYTNYVPSSDNTYIISDIQNHSSLTNTIKSALRNTRKLTIVDKDDILSSKGYNRLRDTLLSDRVDLYNEITDEVSLKIASELGDEYTYKKGVIPYDLVIFKGKEIKALVKITFNMLSENDILEESHMIYDKEYDEYNKVVISLDDLYFNREEIIRNLKDVVENEYRE
ncbi:hypothetical protein RJG79_00335 [Mycoplasmatota bacterium WC44]